MSNWMFSHGDRVQIVRSPVKYGPDMIGRYGTVKSAYYNSVSVAVDGLTNNRGSTGLFYFSPVQLAPATLTPEDALWRDATSDFVKSEMLKYAAMRYAQNDIETAKVIITRVKNEKEETPMLKNYRVAGIKFKDGYNPDKTYPYALYDSDIIIGDAVVVMTGHHGMAIAEVCSIGEMPKDSVTCGREIICKVDMTAYIDRKARAKQMAELKKEMDEKVKALQETALYELMAEKDPSLKALLEQFKALDQ